MVKDQRIPVYLLTGYLGSGKTTLLAAWLQQPELADAALVINEIGEVGLDNRLLGFASESASLVANACVCCTGLPGLEEALADLFWARLHRKIPRFGSVVIETTGLADPRPIMAVFESEPLLHERYRLAAVIATVSAVVGAQVLAGYEEARAQVSVADVVVVTKVDQVNFMAVDALLADLRRVHGVKTSVTSSNASLTAAALLRLVSQAHEHAPGHEHAAVSDRSSRSHEDGHHDARAQVGEHDHDHDHDHDHADHDDHVHGAVAMFLPLPEPISREAVLRRIDGAAASRVGVLLRIKGVVDRGDGSLETVQWSLGDGAPSFAPLPMMIDGKQPHGGDAHGNAAIPFGLTFIVGTAPHSS
jgi:G3E family GTPase